MDIYVEALPPILYHIRLKKEKAEKLKRSFNTKINKSTPKM